MAQPTITDARTGDGRVKRGPKADPRREYVAGGGWQWTQNYFRSLPFWVDDLTRDFGDDLYERMLVDPQVAKCVDLLKMGILADGIQLTPAVDAEDPRRAQAEQITDFCRRQIAGLEAPFDFQTAVPLYWQLWSLLDGIALGHKVAEQVYVLADDGVDAGKLCLQALKVKPRRTIAMVVDTYLNLIGLLGLVPGQGATVITQSVIGDPDQMPNLVPRRKFAIFTYQPHDSDPRGSSVLRPAYEPWWNKRQTSPEHLRYLGQFGGASLIGKVSDQAAPMPAKDANGEFLLDGNGDPILVTPIEALLEALLTFRNGFAVALPAGTEVDTIESEGDGSAFLGALDYWDRQIAGAILGQTLATEEGKHQARASSETHQDILGLRIALGKAALAVMLRRDVLRNLVEYNFGREALDLTPQVSLSTEHHDFAADATAIAALAKADYFDPSQLQALDARLGLPVRSDEAVERAIRRQEAAAAAPSPTAPAGEPDGDEEQENEKQ